jgi:hypothetical protein
MPLNFYSAVQWFLVLLWLIYLLSWQPSWLISDVARSSMSKYSHGMFTFSFVPSSRFWPVWSSFCHQDIELFITIFFILQVYEKVWYLLLKFSIPPCPLVSGTVCSYDPMYQGAEVVRMYKTLLGSQGFRKVKSACLSNAYDNPDTCSFMMLPIWCVLI